MAKIIVVTSGKGGVGKTTTSAAFATGLAMRGYRTVVIDFRCDQQEMVFPMVPSGASNDDIILGPGQPGPAIDPNAPGLS